MKIQCDVCEKEEATLFCSADEAALCDCCDRRVHRANKLASKHTRYSLLHPTFKDSPLCDICQERRALLFCQEDRAILCRECDIPIHRASEHAQKHSRFLLTGVKLSPSTSPAAHCPQPPLPSSAATTSTGFCSQESSLPQGSGFVNPTFEVGSSGGTRAGREEENQMVVSDGGSMPTSSISEYLMETLPGWRVDEFLDCSHHLSHYHPHHHHNNNNNSWSSNGYCKTFDYKLAMPDYDFGSDASSSSPAPRDILTPVPQFFAQPLHKCPPQDQTSFFSSVR